MKDPNKNSALIATQRQLIWWKFKRHKVALVSLIVLAITYFVVIFASFFAVNDPYNTIQEYVYAGPTKIHIIDDAGQWHMPFVYGLISGRDPVTLGKVFQEDMTQRYTLKFFGKGYSYKILGFISLKRHFIGVEEGGLYYPFGADSLGRCLYSRILYGGRISLSICFVGIFFSTIIGVIIGGISGYFGGAIDTAIQRVIEFIRSIPTFPLWMGLSVALPPEWGTVQTYLGIVIILSLVGWTGLARMVRSKFLSLREEDFVMAARVHGASEGRVIFKHLLPTFYSHIIAIITLSIPNMILGETSLSFIGLGLQAPAISWGVLLQDAQTVLVLSKAPWLLLPGAFIIIAVLAFNFLGDGIRDAADPYST